MTAALLAVCRRGGSSSRRSPDAYRRIGGGSDGPCSACNTSPARWTTGIPPSRIRLATGGKSFCSTARSRPVNRQGADDGRPECPRMRWQFLDGLCVTSCDVLGFSLGGMVAQQMALDRPSSIRRMILVGMRRAAVKTSP